MLTLLAALGSWVLSWVLLGGNAFFLQGVVGHRRAGLAGRVPRANPGTARAPGPSIFEERNIQVTTPTSIQIPLSFTVGEIAFYSKSDLEDTTQLITQFINEAGSGKRILMWEEGDILNFGYLKVVDNVTELHYISIEVGK